MNLIEQLRSRREHLKELETQLSSAAVLSDPQKIREVNEVYAREREVMEVGERYEKAFRDLEGARETISTTKDIELIEMAQQEITEIESRLPTLEHDLTIAMIPPDPLDTKSIIVEIRAGAGGDESTLFVSELLRTYTLYAEAHGWKVELVSANRSDIGGFKEVIVEIKGLNAYSRLKYESGVHRVQRVPETEKAGRVHTSTITVAILPEVEEVDVKIRPEDLEIQATTATGAGGQSVNTTYSAVRITHIPTGLMVYCQEERSFKQNKERALSIIRSRVFALEQERLRKERESARRGQVGTGDRSEKIRTYNFPQDRLTDHRINQNFHNLPAIMSGGLDEIIEELKRAEIEERLSELN
ncbi:MAG: Peptide chain release factor 1 [Candidatus Uhrbacteria bacterium GW2011_GWA2_52_8d]|uniref:Peptide chain release factor 1 n=1 Tax=Candidatus Uhrbacteria bacterium GW2011_GWA2_52_8d TaxID=1618979 RepID=A0A0G1ZU11_9BACT|nr:MAG: Peptide chain release factor 1 [Candidatus Uhrbacteria bacterium GW2011_GWA2_52_8d]